MKKRILSVLLVIVMLIGIIPAAFGATPKVMLTVEASNSAPNVGDEVTFTLYIQTSDGGSVSGFELPIDVPTGLTYVASSGAVDSSFKSTTGAENFEWIESGTKFFCSSSALEGLSGLSTRQAVGSFKCTVNDDASGTYNVGVSVFALEDKDVSPVTGTDLKNEKATITVAAHEHSWAAAWTKNETHHWHECENSGCDVTENSGKDGYAAHTYDQEIATAEYKATDATCTAKATYYKSCVCGAKGTATFESGAVNASNHTGTLSGWQTDSSKHWKEYSCCGAKVEEGEHVYTDDADTTCNTCGYIRTITPSHTHSWATAWSKNETHHWHECENSGCDVTENSGKNGYAAHTYDQQIATAEYKATDATCTAKATYYKSCVCGAKGTVTFESGEVNASNHTGTLSGWQTDSSKHWKEYSCCHVKVEEGTHVYDDDADTTCNTCGYIRTITPSHTHSWATAWSKNETHHWHECENSGCDVTENSGKDGYAAHTYDQQIATAEYKATDATCTAKATYYKSCVCGAKGTETFESGAVNASNHTGTLSGWQTDSSKHWKEYSCCGAKVEEGEHVYTDDADTTCNTCGYTRTITPSHTHSWDTAWSKNETHHWHECTADGCDVTENSGKNGYGTHDYTDDADTTCNTCGYERTVTPPAHEHICGDWQHNRLYHWKVCTICGEIVDKARHNYGGDRTCDDCGYVKPRTSSSTTPSQSTDTTKSADTGDMGIALYAGMTVLSLTGGAWVVNKKRKSK